MPAIKLGATMTYSPDLDARFMQAAIRLARRNEGQTADNPSVAAIIVQMDGDNPIIVGHGVTAIGGRPHAEVIALENAGPRAAGACIYVTLEPCAHVGRTPPCAEALIKAGISRVVVAVGDPDPRVSGKGFDLLKKAGIEVVQNVCTSEAEIGLSGFLSRINEKRPFVTLKLAMSADGHLGVKSGRQVKITGDVSNGQVHILRAVSDAILIGSGTALNDDPSLTCRLNGLQDRSPTRVLLDRRVRVTEFGQLMRSAVNVPTIMVTLEGQEDNIKKFPDELEAIFLKSRSDQEQLNELLSELLAHNISTLLVEGGAAIASAFLQYNLVDRLIIFQSQSRLRSLLGEDTVSSPITPANMPEHFELQNQMTFGNDICYEYLKK